MGIVYNAVKLGGLHVGLSASVHATGFLPELKDERRRFTPGARLGAVDGGSPARVIHSRALR